ncbi:sugar phosphate isomerase/epimerase family protein [Flavihumibacter profundi]|jgi:L-ribulose-5-phosphate 3-epimerase|uniref:sugar phosphate isomerase/epimerase family protein n=1 Tax=Flavihumibacter profundi TaxID=2716883 RepID=UPI001CC52F7C|nr:sugar phosphate isomerase/epimerase [Flavihumibacter profundi]MBZ5858786.1 sugar phosphate isomerase/epimerase [Flavihumibacter profundi]
MKHVNLSSCKFLLFALLLVACGGQPKKQENTTASGDGPNEWKLGVALWTFHTFSFPDALDKVDSSGIKYVEANMFQKAGIELKDTVVGQLSPDGIEKLKLLLQSKGLAMESIYIAGDTTVASWKKQFDIAKQFGVKFVVGEPPVYLWDSIDSLAGLYGLKLAIHEHWKGVSAYWHPDSVLAAIKGHPNFGACADLGHWPKSGVDPVEGVKKLAGHIMAIHLKDIAAFNDSKLLDVRVGTGVVNFPAVFEELKRQGFKGNINVERDYEGKPSNLPSLKETITYYNEQVGKLK